MVAGNLRPGISDEADENKQVAASLPAAVLKRFGHSSRAQARPFLPPKEQKTSFYRNV
jgi:hypothetical protein